jgi:hypothetical protein
MTDSPASEFELQRWGLSIDVPLPAPMRERWQPLRSGVVNLYRYDVEEFHYAEGRLLLRGNNGSGKSRVLALQLPFLLDGEVTPARVEPDGDVAKRIEWNLLMGRHKDRTGYSWIEFGRRAADGTVSFCTLGCGLRAVEGHTGLHSRWFFVTARRIGRDFFLLNEQRIPFGRERLAEQLGTGGRVLQKADDYRRAVDEALFGLGPRYGALIDLLLRLRRPQLTRKLDENELPEALSEALPTLSATIVDEVAESFRGLQADKDTLRDFVSTRDAVGAFLREYAGYLRIAVRRRAAEVRTSQSAYEHTQRSARDAQTRLDEASAALALLAAVQGELQMQLAAVESDERTLAESPEMKTADEIRRAREGAEASAQTLAVAHSDESAANRAAALASSRLRQAEEAAAVVIASRDTALDRTAAAALAADLAGAHNQHLPSAETGLSGETPLARVLGRRHEAMKLLRECERTVHAAEAALIAAEHALSAAQSAATSFRETEHNAREELDTRAAALSAAYRTWHESVRHLRPAPPSELSEPFALWLERREGQAPFQRAAEVARDTAVTAFAARAHALDRSAVDLAASIELITAEIERLEHGETPPPPPALHASLGASRPQRRTALATLRLSPRPRAHRSCRSRSRPPVLRSTRRLAAARRSADGTGRGQLPRSLCHPWRPGLTLAGQPACSNARLRVPGRWTSEPRHPRESLLSHRRGTRRRPALGVHRRRLAAGTACRSLVQTGSRVSRRSHSCRRPSTSDRLTPCPSHRFRVHTCPKSFRPSRAGRRANRSRGRVCCLAQR